MTGAQLLKDHDNMKSTEHFELGSEVSHPKYGIGEIMELSGNALKRRVRVKFHNDQREETFILQKSPLSLVTNES